MGNSESRMPETGPFPGRGRFLTRRQFLREAGALVAAIGGFGSSMAGLLGGCDDGGQAGNTTATVHAQQSSTTSVTTSTSTTAVVGPETGRDIRIGVVTSLTGPLALFGKANEWWIASALEYFSDGLVCGDNRHHRLVFLKEDSRSNPDQAARSARRAIVDGRADLIMCSGGGNMVGPVVGQAESLKCPCLCGFVEWRQFLAAGGENLGRKLQWSYAHAIGLEDIATAYVNMWDRLETNKKVGLVFADNVGGRIWADATAGLPPIAAEAGYECVVPGLYPVSTGDYSAFISEFRKNGCEICCGVFTTADFVDFWQQALDLDYRPKIMTVGEGLLFPHALEALRPRARNFTSELLWHPEWPYRDSITGRTCRELANDYMANTGDQWIAPIAQYAGFEWAVDAFKRVDDINSPESIVAQVARSKVETCLGSIDFTSPVDLSSLGQNRRPAHNVYKAPVGGGQWVPGDSLGFKPLLISNANNLELRTQDVMRAMDYNTSSSSTAY